MNEREQGEEAGGERQVGGLGLGLEAGGWGWGLGRGSGRGGRWTDSLVVWAARHQPGDGAFTTLADPALIHPSPSPVSRL